MSAIATHKKLVLFHRDFRGFTGGHLKVWDYFDHVAASTGYEPRIAFTPESVWNETNPWTQARDRVAEWEPNTADVLFLAGKDWQSLPKKKAPSFAKPVINLIQHPRHADPKDELYQFLSKRAIRICVSTQVADAIKETGQVNGPVFVNPNGIDLSASFSTPHLSPLLMTPHHALTGASRPSLPKGERGGEEKEIALPNLRPYDDRSVVVLLCGLKAPVLAKRVRDLLSSENIEVVSLDNWVPRSEYLARLSDAKVAVMLPRKSEGFYLPALEAMACAAVVVCPDCIGNRDFCNDKINCFRPPYDEGDIAAAVRKAVRYPTNERNAMLENAARTVAAHSLERERANFLQILGRVDELWAG